MKQFVITNIHTHVSRTLCKTAEMVQQNRQGKRPQAFYVSFHFHFCQSRKVSFYYVSVCEGT